MAEPKKTNYLTGAAILAAAVALTKVVGAIYKIPLFNLLGDVGTGHFNVTYNIYSLILIVTTAGIPMAISRLISEARATSRPMQARRYYRVALFSFGFIGLLGSAAMIVWAPELAEFMKDPDVVLGVRLLAPAVFFGCILAVQRGYAQGHSEMLPTAISQIVEVMCKLVFGLAIAWYLRSIGSDLATIAAGAIVGVTIGIALDVPLVWALCRKIARRSPSTLNLDRPDSPWATLGKILRVSIPITVSASVLNFFNLIDTHFIRERLLNSAGFGQEMVDTLWGVYSKGVTLFTLPTSFITPISMAVVPVIAGAVASRRGEQTRSTMESSMKLTNLLGMPAAVGLAVLSGPIFDVFFPGSNENGPVLLALLGIASWFVCTYIITNGILQASGYEWLALLSMPVGGICKVAVNYVLVGDPEINIMGAPIGTLVCYLVITVLNIIFMTVKLRERPNYLRITFRPLVCALLMGAASWGVYGLSEKYLFSALGAGRLSGIICLALAVGIGVLLYAVLIIVLRAVTKEDILLLPKGEKLAKLLKLS